MKFTPRRTGMTLMEIMMSVMILGLGLLGILSVIPFIEFHSARVVESDFTAAAGTNAFAVIRSRQWEKPATWQQYADPASLNDGMVVDNFIFPRFFDILGEHGTSGNPGLPNWDIELGIEGWNPDLYGARDIIPHVYPAGGYGYVDRMTGDFVAPTVRDKDVCRAQDDIVVERDENSPARPRLLLDETGRTSAPEFTGAYTWAAMMTPVASDPSQPYTQFTFPGNRRIVDNGIPRAEVAMKVDTLVFRGRDALDNNDWLVGSLAPTIGDLGDGIELTGINGSGLYGGQVNIVPPFFGANGNNGSLAEFEKSLGSSTHILLIGPSDQSAPNPAAPFLVPCFSGWYKINNYSRGRASDGTEFFALTLSGPSVPACWVDVQNDPLSRKKVINTTNAQSANVRAVLFRDLRGVFSQTVPVTELE